MRDMTVRALALDLDGTLLRSDGTLDARTTRALAAARAAGMRPIVCTARPPRWLAGLRGALGHGGVAICSNGAIELDLSDWRALQTRTLAATQARAVVAAVRRTLAGATWAVERLSGYAREPTYRSRWPAPPNTPVAPIETLLAEPVLKLLVRFEGRSADQLLAPVRAAVGTRAHVTHSNSADCLLEISAPGVDKAGALADLCARLGIDAAEVIAFGDMPNDLPMLAWAGRAVAVANAHPAVLAAADEITASNDQAGVAQVLERLLADG